MNREPHFDENEVLRQCMSPLNEEVPDMPENFHAQWTALVKEDAMKQEETRKVAPMRRWTRILSVAAALVFVVGGTLLTKDSLSPARTSAPQSLADSYDYDYDTYTSDVGRSRQRCAHDDGRRRERRHAGSRQREIRRCGGQENHPQRVADHQNIRL